jgi:hypothetical protein
MNKKTLLVQERYGGILVSLTYSYNKKKEIISQINYIIPQRRSDGELINDEIKNILVGKNNFILSNKNNNNVADYIKILGEEPKIEFSKMSIANNEQIDYLASILKFYKKDIDLKKDEYSTRIKKINEFSHNGNIYMFDREVNELAKRGLRINPTVLSELRHQCYSGR